MTTRTKPPFRAAARLAGAVVIAIAATSPPAAAQLDELLFLKRVMPNVIVVVDTSFRMLEDGQGRYFDPVTYNVSDDPELARALGVDPSTGTAYRRVYVNLRFTQAQDSSTKYAADRVIAVPNTASHYASLYQATRYDMAVRGIEGAVSLNRGSRFRWGLMRLPQTGAAWPVVANGCDKPVLVSDADQAQISESWAYCAAGNERLGIFTPTVTDANASAPNANAHVVAVTDANSASLVLNRLSRKLPDYNAFLIPAGRDTDALEDRPLAKALAEARARAVTAISGDLACPTCRNTVVVLVAGGADRTADVLATAQEFRALTVNGLVRRVPIYVVGVNAPEADKDQLSNIASVSGGVFFDTRDATGVTRAINRALQAGFGRWSEFNAGEASEHVTVSPVVGTVNLVNAASATGLSLDNDEVSTPQGVHIPQRNNFLVTAGFAIGKAAIEMHPNSPGFDGRIRAFRTYVPEEDGTKPSGYTFTKDGTPLWPDRDGRPHLAGTARAPADPSVRNIYTYVPGQGTIAFNTMNAETLRPLLGGADPWQLIPWIRSLPLGAVVGSTPAVMDPPSMDPPPDTDYGRPEGDGTYAARYKDRRSIIWVGANDGMLHGIDARTGYEVWAFIPYNLLPKLKTLAAGQPVEQFSYFVDHSAKIAEVKMSGQWRTCLIIGEGPGGTFYQAFDVTEAGMGGPLPSSDDYGSVLQTFADPNRVQFKWSFPSYGSFDPNLRADIGTADATPGSVVGFYGDLSLAASPAERTVGFTWSDPAVGPLDLNRTVNVAIVGSGYFPWEAEAAASPLVARRGGGTGRAFYLIQMEDGKLLGNASGNPCTGTGCISVDEVINGRKNALQADPTVTGDPGAHVAKKAYMGDLDGSYWRFGFTATGALTKTLMYSTGQPIYASSALMTVGTTQQYVFFATGSDLLPTAPAVAGGTGTFKLYSVKDTGLAGTLSFSQSLAAVTDNAGVPAGERPSASPSVAGDIVFFTTTVESATPCTDFKFNLWALTYLGGSAYLPAGATPPGNKNNSPPEPIKSGAGRATAPFVVDQHLWFGTTGAGGASIEAFGDPNDFNNGVGQVGVRILSWREIRR